MSAQPIRSMAALLTGALQPFEVVELELREPEHDEYLVRITAAPFCSTDWMAQRSLRGKQFPVVLGHAAVGTVERSPASGGGAPVGQRVLVASTPECGSCYYCLVGRPDQCDELFGSGDPVIARHGGAEVTAAGGVGAYAERVIAKRSQVHPVNSALPDEVVALIGCGVATGAGAIQTIAEVTASDTVAIMGLGHIGLWATQMAVALGATVIGIDPHPGRRTLATGFCAARVIDPGKEDPLDAVRELTGGRGADIVIEAAGPEYAAKQALALARRGGTVVLIGAHHASRSEIVLPQIEVTVFGKRVLGCQNGQISPAKDVTRWLSLLESGTLSSRGIVTQRYRLDEVSAAADASALLRDVTGIIEPNRR